MSDELQRRIAVAAETLTITIDDWPVAEGVLAFLVERAEWKTLERAYRILLRGLSSAGEAVVVVGGMPREDREVWLWRELGRLYRDRLGDDDAAIEAIQMVCRHRMESVDDHLELAALHEKKESHNPLSLYDWLLKLAPTRPEIYERIFALHTKRNAIDAAWCAASALVLLEKADDATTRFYEAHAPRELPVRTRPLDDEEWKMLQHPDENPVVTSVLQCVVSILPPKARRHAIDEAVLAWAADTLGVSTSTTPLPAHASRDDIFRAGWEAASLRCPAYALAPDAITTRVAVFLAAVKTIEASFGVPEHYVTAVNQIQDRLRLELSPDELSALRVAVTAFLGRGRIDMKQWSHGVEIARLRVGLLLAGDTPRVRASLRADDLLTPAEKLAEAAAFTASVAHVRLRAALDLGIGETKRMTITGIARTTAEMRFAVSLQRCTGCGNRELEPRDPSGTGHAWSIRGVCRSCGAASEFDFETAGDPRTTRRGRSDLGPLQSKIIPPEEFLRVLDASTPLIPEQRSPSPEAAARARVAITRALTCVIELLKLVPLENQPMPGATDPRLLRSTLSAEHKRLAVLGVRHRPPSSVSDDAIAAHAAYLERGATGAGCIEIDGQRMVGESYVGAAWGSVTIANSDLTDVDLPEARLPSATLRRVTFTGASLRAAVLTKAVITGGTWTNANLSNLVLDDATIEGTDFTASDMPGSSFRNARVTKATFDGVRFGSAVLDHARFEGCTFRDASFAMFTSTPEATSAGAEFVDCNLEGTDWNQRDLSNTRFVRCVLDRTRGTPTASAGLVLEECNVTTSAFLGVETPAVG